MSENSPEEKKIPVECVQHGKIVTLKVFVLRKS